MLLKEAMQCNWSERINNCGCEHKLLGVHITQGRHVKDLIGQHFKIH